MYRNNVDPDRAQERMNIGLPVSFVVLISCDSCPARGGRDWL
jgi:hypothetical protein